MEPQNLSMKKETLVFLEWLTEEWINKRLFTLSLAWNRQQSDWQTFATKNEKKLYWNKNVPQRKIKIEKKRKTNFAN